jgi:hypothetical protein
MGDGEPKHFMLRELERNGLISAIIRAKMGT